MAVATRGKKNQKIDETTKAQVLAKVAAMNATDLNNEFSSMQLNVQKIFAGLQADVTNRFATCDELDTAISLKQSRLKDLHAIEASAITLDDLQAELDEQRKVIDDERAAADASQQEQHDEWMKEKKRLEDEWTYTTDQQHRKKMDEFQQGLLKQQRDEAIRQEALQKSWKEREDKLVEREAELDSLRKQVDNFPKQLDAEVKKANAVLENSIKREFETKIALMSKDAEVATKLNKERETAFQSTITRLEGQNTSLQQQVEAAEKRAAEIAKTAFESVSGRDALAAVQRSHTETQQQQSGKSGR